MHPKWDLRDIRGPFDVVGDVHGCIVELERLLRKLGACPSATGWKAPHGRKLVFLGDLVDRGPGVVEVLRIAMQMTNDGDAICLTGNHEHKLVRALKGNPVKVANGLERSLEQLARQPPAFREEVIRFFDGRAAHHVLDEGRLVVAHAGLTEELHRSDSNRARTFALFGDTTGATDEAGYPVRRDWAAAYRGNALMVYGHTPVAKAVPAGRTICIDTGCVFGGSLTAYRYPEGLIESAPAASTYWPTG